MNTPDQQKWQRLDRALTNASNAQEVIDARIEAFYAKFFDLVRKGRFILISSFGYKTDHDGKLVPRNAQDNKPFHLES